MDQFCSAVDKEIIDTLREYHCDVAQGYFYGKPMPPDMFETWLKANGKPTLHRSEDEETAKQAG